MASWCKPKVNLRAGAVTGCSPLSWVHRPPSSIYFNGSDCELWLLSSVDSFVWFSVFYLQFLFHTAALRDGWVSNSDHLAAQGASSLSSSRVSQVCHFILLQQGWGKKENTAKVELSDWQRTQPLGAVNLTSWMECFTNPQDLFHVSIGEKPMGNIQRQRVPHLVF